MTRQNSAPDGNQGRNDFHDISKTTKEQGAPVAAGPADWPVLPGTFVLKISEQRNRQVILVHSDENHDENSRCPCCGLKKLVKHGTDKQDFDDIPISGIPVIVRVQRDGHKCGWCEEAVAAPSPSWAAPAGVDGGRATQRLIDFSAAQTQSSKAVEPIADAKPKRERRQNRPAKQQAIDEAAAEAEIQRRYEDNTRHFFEEAEQAAKAAKAAEERLAAERPVQAEQEPVDSEQQEFDAVRARLLGLGGSTGPRTARSVLTIPARGQNRPSHTVEVVTKRRKSLSGSSAVSGDDSTTATASGERGTLMLGDRR